MAVTTDETQDVTPDFVSSWLPDRKVVVRLSKRVVKWSWKQSRLPARPRGPFWKAKKMVSVTYQESR